jgi:ketosteroid isomerase-like protein
MRAIRLVVTSAVLLVSTAAVAQDPSQAADHDALRKVKADVLHAINARDLRGLDMILHKPVSITLVTQDIFADAAALQAYYDGLFTRKFLRMAKITMDVEADELSQIYTGTFAMARGSTKELYELADGRRFDMRGRWTATLIKEDGQWKVLAIHSGINFLDNPVLTAVEKSTTYVGGGGAAVGLVLGFLLGFFLRRRHA